MSEKTEKPTPHRLKRARRDGDIAKSVHLSAALSGVFWWPVLLLQAPRVYAAFVAMIQTVLSLDLTRDLAWQLKTMLGALVEPLYGALTIAGFGIMAAIVPELAQTRGLVSTKRITPDFKRLNPIAGFKNLFSLRVLFDTVILLIQFGILIEITWHEIVTWIGLASSTYALTAASQLALTAHLHAQLLALVALTQLAPAIADYAIQRFLLARRLRMDKQELKREFRDEQGDPHVKARRRALHRQLNQ